MAEGVGFEPTETQKTSTVFETVPFVRSGSLPKSRLPVKRERPVYEQTVPSSGTMSCTRYSCTMSSMQLLARYPLC
jgi:hypothetical protein